MSFLRLFNRFILRDLVANPARTLLTLTGVGLGVAVVVGVHIANDRALGSFNDSLDLLGGGADLRISANGLALDENLVGQLGWVWDIGTMTAIVEGRVRLDPPRDDQPLLLFGADFLSDAPFRRYPLAEGAGDPALGIARDGFMDLLTDPTAIVVPRSLARSVGVGVGDALPLQIAGGHREFRVASILDDSGAAAAFDGRVVFMDIAAAQWALNRLGTVDRIEISLDDPSELDRVAERLRVQLPDTVLVRTPSETIANTGRMTRAFRYNLAALSYIAVIVGVILIYNTLSVALSRRTTELGVLRTLGAEGWILRRMFLLEAGLFGLAGAALGIGLGAFLAQVSGALVSRTISAIYTGWDLSPTNGGLDWGTVAGVLILGAGIAFASGAGPALRAMRISPVDALRRGAGDYLQFGSSPRLTRAGGAALAFGCVLAFAPPVAGFPFLGYAAGVAWMVGLGLMTPRIAEWMISFLRRGLIGVFPVEGRLAVQAIRRSLGRVTVAVLSLSIAVAMLVSVAIMVASFRDTVIVWVDQTLKGDLYLRPAISDDQGRSLMDARVLNVLISMPEIAALDRFRETAIEYDGFPAVLGAGEFETLASHNGLLFVDGRSAREVTGRVVDQDAVVVSEPFAVRHGLKAGDTVFLPAAGGERPFRVEAVFYDYSTEGGLIVMDRSTWIRRFGDSSVNTVAVYLRSGEDAGLIRERIASDVPDSGVRIATNGELRAQVLQVFDQTFEVTYALEVIALAVALLGIANTLAALVLERKPELAMLRFVGAARSQLRRMVVAEAAVVGLLGSILGLILGLGLSVLLIYVINFQSFGWTIQFELPFGFILQSLLLVLLATVAAGFYPAALALKSDPIEAIRTE